MPDELNPFASPSPVDRDDRPPTTGDAVLLDRGLLMRRVRLPEPSSAVVEYSGRGLGYDAVRVDGRVAVWRWKWVWFVPRFDFHVLLDDGSIPAVLTVEIGWSLRINRLTIEVDDQLVYEEHA
ncbi:MAG: hypothetical protein AAF596_07100 [Planctomycetota bacterium]